MKNAFLATIWMLPWIASSAIACSCNKVEIPEALQRAATVVVARVVSTQQMPIPDDPSGNYILEYATFEVIQAFKGSTKVGDNIQIRSEIGPGSCGRSARNSPTWLDEAPVSSSNLTKAFPVSDTWLVFGYGSEPYELSLCSRSSPMNVRGEEDLEILHTLIKRSQEQHEP